MVHIAKRLLHMCTRQLLGRNMPIFREIWRVQVEIFDLEQLSEVTPPDGVTPYSPSNSYVCRSDVSLQCYVILHILRHQYIQTLLPSSPPQFFLTQELHAHFKDTPRSMLRVSGVRLFYLCLDILITQNVKDDITLQTYVTSTNITVWRAVRSHPTGGVTSDSCSRSNISSCTRQISLKIDMFLPESCRVHM